MMLKSFVFAAALGVGAAACGESQNVDDSAASSIGGDSSATGQTPATVGSNPEPVVDQEVKPPRAELPETASPMATIGIAGLLALGMAGALRALRR